MAKVTSFELINHDTVFFSHNKTSYWLLVRRLWHYSYIWRELLRRGRYMTTTCLRCHGLHRLVLSWCLRCHSLHRLIASMCMRCHSPRRLVVSMCMRCHNHHRLVASMCMMRCDNLHYKRNRHMHNKRPHDNKKCLQKKFMHKKVPARSQKFENCIQCTKGDPMCWS